jgi:hypothetical protein
MGGPPARVSSCAAGGRRPGGGAPLPAAGPTQARRSVGAWPGGQARAHGVRPTSKRRSHAEPRVAHRALRATRRAPDIRPHARLRVERHQQVAAVEGARGHPSRCRRGVPGRWECGARAQRAPQHARRAASGERAGPVRSYYEGFKSLHVCMIIWVSSCGRAVRFGRQTQKYAAQISAASPFTTSNYVQHMSIQLHV